MTDQEIMREMAKKDIHSITIESYRGDKHPNRVPRPAKFVGTHIEWLNQRVDTVIEYGRNK